MKPEKKEENINACLCPTCPLYGECNNQQEEKFFCGTRRSDCSMDATKACICGSCAVFDKYDLSDGYFCIKDILK